MDTAKRSVLNSSRVAIYIRVSTGIQADSGDSLPMQKQDLLAYAKLMLNTEDCVVFEDAGYSGKNTDRPQFQDMMRRMRAGDFTHLLVWKIDRISRNLLDFAAMYAELKDLGVTFVSKNEQFDTSTAMGEAMLKIILVFAELERNMTSERVTATMISRASNGLWNGGRIPYGYDYNLSTHEFSFNEDERQVVVLIHDKYEEIRSLVRVSRWLNSHGYSTRAGNEWNPVSLLIILRSRFYCGDYVYNRLKEGVRQKPKDESEWVTVENHHPAMVSREQKFRVIAILESNSKLAKEHNIYSGERENVHVFGGLVFCGVCNRLMNSTSVTRKKEPLGISRYGCPTRRRTGTDCMNPSVTDITVGDVVFNLIVNMLNAQADASNITSTADLSKRILGGGMFSYVSSIDEDDLADLLATLKNGAGTAIYGKGATVVKTEKADTELRSLTDQKTKLERAIDRLTKLYLYSNDAMPESEYVIQKSKLTEQLQDIMDRIGMLTTDAWSSSVSDEEFIQRASEFIIAQRLTGRKFISYKSLASDVDAASLKSFVLSVIDSITILGGKVAGVVFRNGLSIHFNFR